jgi:citrate lyase subunit beta/citryl-CoA lyase
VKYRSWLFVPGDSERKLAKVSTSKADIVILDLEDSVAPDRKNEARELVTSVLRSTPRSGEPSLWVRINPMSSPLSGEDLAIVVPARPAGIVLPKPESAEDVSQLDAHLTKLETSAGLDAGSIRVLATATETARAVAKLASYAGHPDRLWGLTWGAEDLAADLGATTNKGDNGELGFTFRVARSMCHLTAAAAGVPIVETIYADFRDTHGLERWARRARREGFVGMLAIHPGQVPVINGAFTPSAEEITFARRVVEAFAAQQGTGVVGLDGRMLDRPHLRQAERTLQLAGTR